MACRNAVFSEKEFFNKTIFHFPEINCNLTTDFASAERLVSPQRGSRLQVTRTPWIAGLQYQPSFEKQLLKRKASVWKDGDEDQAHKEEDEFQVCIAVLNTLKACAEKKDLRHGTEIHADIVKRGLLKKNKYVGTTLLRMYARCGSLARAQEVFDELPTKDVVSWSALIAGYAQHGLGYEALECFRQMQDQGLSPSTVTFICLLKACGAVGATDKGEEIHAEVSKQGLMEKDIMLGNALVDMYGKCGRLEKAQEVFDELPLKDAVSWNALISGYVQHGLTNEALKCFDRMQVEGFSANAVTFICLLKACGSIGAIDKGKEIHAEISKQRLLGKDIVLGNALIDMYGRCGVLVKAQKVFDELPTRDVVSWTALITGYVQHDLNDAALKCFGLMLHEGFTPNTVTFICLLKACGNVGAVEKGKELHTEISKRGLLRKDIALGNALVDMYAKCGELKKAKEVFDKLTTRDVISWNVLIAGYAQHGLGNEALKCFELMQDKGFFPDLVTFVCLLDACGSVGAVHKGKEIHAEVKRKGILGKSIVLNTALMDMYAKCGEFAKAQEIFDELPVRDVIFWNALIAGYAQHGLGDEALKCFLQMQNEGFFPDSVTFICIFRTCGNIGAAEKGEDLYAEVDGLSFFGKDVLLMTSLVDMYGKCGLLAKAQKVFDQLVTRDALSWTTLIAGYAHLGKIKMVLTLVNKMIEEHMEPINETFVVLITACSHTGLLEEGQLLFDSMSTGYVISPKSQHHVCMIDLFSRAGCLDKAVDLIINAPPDDYMVLWLALLGACGKWVNVELGKWVFEHIVQWDEKNAAAYVCMSNMFADAFGKDQACPIDLG